MSILIASGFIILFTVLIEKRILGSRYITCIFFLIFMVLAPINEKINNIIYYEGFGPSEESYYYVSLVVIFFSIFLFLSSFFFRSGNLAIELPIVKSVKFIFMIPWVAGFIYIWLMDWIFGTLYIREPAYEISNVTFMRFLIADRFIRPLISISVFICFVYSKKKVNKIVSLIPLVLFCFPTAMPRFLTVIIYLPFLFLFLNNLLKNNKGKIIKMLLINSIILFCVPFFFIILNYFRNFEYIRDHFTIDISTNISNFLNAGHLDSFQGFQNAIDYVDITWGKQLLTSIFFFIPREFWADKPVGTGGLIASNSGYTWLNVSGNYFAEGYVNFGFLGVVLFSFILIYFLILFDRLNTSKLKFFLIFYYFPATLFIILRGDMQNAFSILFPIIFICYFFDFALTKSFVVK